MVSVPNVNPMSLGLAGAIPGFPSPPGGIEQPSQEALGAKREGGVNLEELTGAELAQALEALMEAKTPEAALKADEIRAVFVKDPRKLAEAEATGLLPAGTTQLVQSKLKEAAAKAQGGLAAQGPQVLGSPQQTPSGAALPLQQPASIPNVAGGTTRGKGIRLENRAQAMEFLKVAPQLTREQVAGTLALSGDTIGVFTPEEREFLQRLVEVAPRGARETTLGKFAEGLEFGRGELASRFGLQEPPEGSKLAKAENLPGALGVLAKGVLGGDPELGERLKADQERAVEARGPRLDPIEAQAELVETKAQQVASRILARGGTERQAQVAAESARKQEQKRFLERQKEILRDRFGGDIDEQTLISLAREEVNEVEEARKAIRDGATGAEADPFSPLAQNALEQAGGDLNQVSKTEAFDRLRQKIEEEIEVPTGFTVGDIALAVILAAGAFAGGGTSGIPILLNRLQKNEARRDRKEDLLVQVEQQRTAEEVRDARRSEQQAQKVQQRNEQMIKQTLFPILASIDVGAANSLLEASPEQVRAFVNNPESLLGPELAAEFQALVTESMLGQTVQ